MRATRDGGVQPWKWRHKSASLHEQPEPGTPYQYGKAVLRAEYEYDSGVSIIADEAVLDLIAAAPTVSAAARAMLGALKAAVNRAQSFLDTFGDVGDCVTQADIGDWEEAIALADAAGIKADGRQ